MIWQPKLLETAFKLVIQKLYNFFALKVGIYYVFVINSLLIL